jgi:hypothetical protein
MLAVLQELLLSFLKAIADRLLRVRRKRVFSDYVRVQIIAEKFCTGRPTMPVINAEK